MSSDKIKIEEPIDFALPVAKCICGKSPAWIYFVSEGDNEKQYMFYCANPDCVYYRITDPRNDFVDSMNCWNELIKRRCGK